ncbi:hypothetical protein BKA65DRAFT_568002 [Rhexocercosporidium sp. MPI-PUGE-AT-0058]|nr:hypothetical protein BKA65DRAFT_568002 [Rhexocercosporidium sp. MPI-PUGE-AT-0058]
MATKAPVPPTSVNRVLKVNRKTPAALWNRRMLKKLSLALDADPEADLLSILPNDYSKSLAELRKGTSLRHDTRSLLQESDTAIIISTLSDDVEKLFTRGNNLSLAVLELLGQSEVLFRYPHGFSTMVLRVSEAIAVKIVRDVDNSIEYTSIQYLWDQKASVPAPKPHGLIKIGSFYLMFMTFIADLDLEKAWSQLEGHQKWDISSQLDVILSDLRSLPFPKYQSLGGVKGEGCKDPIMTPKDFEDFIFSHPSAGSSVYLTFLRSFCLSDQPVSDCVFTHGDIRPANIKVAQSRDGSWKVLGIIDWEYSGFYLTYWESLKVTNNLSIIEGSDWYLYLPKCVSPLQFPTGWLLDRVWDPHVA